MSIEFFLLLIYFAKMYQADIEWNTGMHLVNSQSPFGDRNPNTYSFILDCP